MTIRYVLTDIEGTTTSITFVHDVLFPYSRQALPAFLKEHWNENAVQEYVGMVLATCREESRPLSADDPDSIVATLISWIEEDRKHPGLKGLQGLVWKDGYQKGAFKAHVYDDVAPNLKAWKKRGLRLGVYSSGSALAQKLLFSHTMTGDLTPLFSDFFDTAVGAKREPSSYEAIQKKIGLPPSDILFLSDVEEELDAAKAIGFATTQLVRPGTTPSQRHLCASTFHNIPILNTGHRRDE